MSLALDTFAAMDNARSAGSAALRQQLHSEADAKRIHMLMSMARIEAAVKRFEHRATECGLRPKVEIPTLVYHHWAAKFKMKDLEAGITTTTGYECWEPGSGFYEWWVARNEEMQYREQKRCAQSSIIVPATRWTPVRDDTGRLQTCGTADSKSALLTAGRVAA